MGAALGDRFAGEAFFVTASRGSSSAAAIGFFAFASGEMSQAQFRKFLTTTLGNGVRVSSEGAVHFVFMDWRHVSDLIEVGRQLYGAMLNLVVWNKSNAGMGSLYRSQHELVLVFKSGAAPHRNNVQLGQYWPKPDQCLAVPDDQQFRATRRR